MNRIRLWSLLSALALAIGVAHAQGADVSAWGANHSGQVGDGTDVTRWTPVPVSGLVGLADGSAVAGGLASGYV